MYTVWIQLDVDMWHYEEVDSLFKAIEVATVMNAVDFTQGELCWRKVDATWVDYKMVVVNV